MYDYTYLIFVLPAVLLSLWASSAVNSRFSKYNKVHSRKGITGAQAAELLLRANGIYDVKIRHISGNLTDNYNPGNKILSLSDSTYSSTSIAAIGVAAHETGHAIQHKVGYAPLGLRSTLVPVANIGSRLGPLLVIAGLGFGYFGSRESLAISQLIMNAGILLFSGAVLFYIITLPVEFNASRRALKILHQTGTLDSSELAGTRSVLWAAAMTYVASALTAVGQLLRLLFISQRRRR
ncbi:zinc metallopeptidase [Treponema zioleckii]|uniref:zinc metallopeptidase n=1 Tax=Treponema zioleckii TaxID=331680 RepID=UPI00168BCC56|nr:zinc metallopeptidase [Treponema zioleckii]